MSKKIAVKAKEINNYYFSKINTAFDAIFHLVHFITVHYYKCHHFPQGADEDQTRNWANPVTRSR